jgi:hypothetical protein
MLILAMLSAIATAGLDIIPAEGMPWLLAFPALTLALLAGRGIYRPRSGSQILDDARSVVAATAVAACPSRSCGYCWAPIHMRRRKRFASGCSPLST